MEPETNYRIGDAWFDTDNNNLMVYNGYKFLKVSDEAKETYEQKLQRLANQYPSVAEAKAHLDSLVAMVEHGE